MPINVFGNSSHDNNTKKIDTSLFVQKLYLRTNYIEVIIEEDIDLNNQYRIKNSPDPISIREPVSKNYVDKIFKKDIDFNDVKLKNIKTVKVNYQHAVNEHLTPKVYVDYAIDEISLVRNNQDNDFNNINLTNIISITLNKQAENANEGVTKPYVDQFHQENERMRRDLGFSYYKEEVDLVKSNQDNDQNVKNLTKLGSITVNGEPTSNNELANEKYIDDELDENTVLRFTQTLQDYLKVSVGNDTYNLAKYDKLQITDTRLIKFGNTGANLMKIGI